VLDLKDGRGNALNYEKAYMAHVSASGAQIRLTIDLKSSAGPAITNLSSLLP